MHILHPSIVLLPTRTPSTHHHGTHTLARHRLQILAIQRLLNHRDCTLQTPSPRRRTHPRAPCSTRWAPKARPRSTGSVKTGARQTTRPLRSTPEVDRRDCARVACEEGIRIFGRAAGVRVRYPTFVSGSGRKFFRECICQCLRFSWQVLRERRCACFRRVWLARSATVNGE